MTIKDFAIERYFARHEFSAKYLLSSSDCDGFAMEYVLNLASDKENCISAAVIKINCLLKIYS